MNTSKNITILTAQGDERVTIGVNNGALGHFTLGSEDYIILPFNTPTAVPFRIGDHVNLTNVLNDVGLGGKFNKEYEVVEIPTPSYDLDTDSLHYDLRLDAYYIKWKNKLFKYIPVNEGDELSWTITGSLIDHLGVLTRNLDKLGYKFGEQELSFEGNVQAEYGQEAKTITYDQTNILDALSQMAQEWECEWWVVENQIHFGKYEHSDAVDVEINVAASEMTKSDSTGTYATRLYVFGSERNLPPNYRPTTENITVNGVVQKRLMMPTPYIDAYRYKADSSKVYIGEAGYDDGTLMPMSEAVEGVVVNEEIYPRTEQEVTYVTSYQTDIMDADNQPTGEKQTFYLIAGDGFAFSEDMILRGKELQIVFKSGNLNGMTFGAIFRKQGEYAGNTRLSRDCFEIVADTSNDHTIPNDYLKPEIGNKWVLTGWDSTKMTGTGLVDAAENELYQYGLKHIKKTMVDDGTYTVKLMSHWVYADMSHRLFDAGQRINLINRAYFDNGRLSRVIGYEIKLDLPYDSPQYTIGESVQYTRIGAVEDKVDALIYNGKQFDSTGSGKGVYLITLNDITSPSITNAYSALRAREEFLKRKENDSSVFHLSLGGVMAGSDDGGEDFDWLVDGFIEVSPYMWVGDDVVEDALLTEAGDELITEDNNYITI